MEPNSQVGGYMGSAKVIRNRKVLLVSRDNGKREKFHVVVRVPVPHSGRDGAHDRAERVADEVGKDAQNIFANLLANGTISTKDRQ